MGIGEETHLGEGQRMDQGLLCSLLLLLALEAAAPKKGNGSVPIWGSGLGATVGPLGSPPPPFDCSLQGLSLISMQMVANHSQDDQEDHFGGFWIWVLVPILLVFAFLFSLIFCCDCLLDRMIATLERTWRSNNFVMRAFNQSSGNGYGALENTDTQVPDGEGSQDGAAWVDDGILWAPFPPRERRDSEVTLEAEDAV